MPEIDVQDWCRNTEYTSGYDPQEPVIQVDPLKPKTIAWLEFRVIDQVVQASDTGCSLCYLITFMD